ncbi:MAG: Ldh family oxidoreductase [Burkholderiaceae bacterium]
MTDAPRYDYASLLDTTTTIFTRAGLPADRARCIAEGLIEADLMGHQTHGLALLPWYRQMIANGEMTLAGEPDVISDRGAAVTWNGRRLPGAWLVGKAVDLAIERARTYGTATVVIADSQHIGALAAYLRRATDVGMMILIASSTPSVGGVAPYGGTRGLFTPDPLAVGIPTDGTPVLIDISASISTLNLAKQLRQQGRDFPYPWAMDANGEPTASTQVVVDGSGTLLPVGGLDHGHKGFGMALMVEALTQGLGGFGRADSPKGSRSNITVQVLDPSAFGGSDAFVRQTSWLAEACRANPPRPGVDKVRMPGERGMARRAEALANGVTLGAAAQAGLDEALAALGLAGPRTT